MSSNSTWPDEIAHDLTFIVYIVDLEIMAVQLWASTHVLLYAGPTSKMLAQKQTCLCVQRDLIALHMAALCKHSAMGAVFTKFFNLEIFIHG